MIGASIVYHTGFLAMDRRRDDNLDRRAWIARIYDRVCRYLTTHVGQEAADEVATNLTYVLDEGELETLADDEIAGYLVHASETAAAECDVALDGIDVETVADAALDAVTPDEVEAQIRLQSRQRRITHSLADVEDDIAAGRSLADDDHSYMTTTVDKWCMKYQGECRCRHLPARCEHPHSAAHIQAVEGVETYRTRTAPLVPRLWRAFEEAALLAFETKTQQTVRGITFGLEDGWMAARLFDGKKIYYWQPTAIRSRFDRDAWAYWEAKDGRLQRTDVYGGKLVQNVVMGLERQLLVHAMARAEREGLRRILNGYDEIVTEPEVAAADWARLKHIMEDRPQWAKDLGLPIAAEGWVGDRYRKG